MTTEQYSIGYAEGYQDGWNAAMDTSSQRKPWEGLAPEEREMHIRYGSTLEDIAISIEAKLKEKNT